MKEKLTGAKLYRIGIVVKDVKAKYEAFEKYFDIDRADLVRMNTSKANFPLGTFTFNGEPLDFNMKIYIFPLGGIEIELIQPLDDRGPYAEFLREHGEGLHHFNIDVDQPDGFRAMMQKELKAPNLTTGDVPHLSWEYYDSRDAFGTILEICSDKPFEKLD